MWRSGCDWERYVEGGAVDGWLITSRPRWDLPRFLAWGFTQVPRERARLVIGVALWEVEPEQVERFWLGLFGAFAHAAPASHQGLVFALWEAVSEPFPRITVLERRAPGVSIAPREKEQPPPARPARTNHAHYVVIEAVTDAEPAAPVPGLRLQLLIAGGEVKSAQTDAGGVARLEGIHASRVVIRVLGVDGALWRPLEGEPAQPSGADEALQWHVVQQGECLSSIAHRCGFDGWKTLWEHPKNAALRKRRKSPHVLKPGDQVAVPGVAVHEIVRPTDATHRIAVNTVAETKLRLRLLDVARAPFHSVQYELAYVDQGKAVRRAGRAPTDADGWLEETLPLLARDVVVRLQRPVLSFPVALGCLDPVQDEDGQTVQVSGMAQRLSGLGYPAGGVGETLDDRTKLALRAFQIEELRRAQATGEPDAETLSALMRAYGV